MSLYITHYVLHLTVCNSFPTGWSHCWSLPYAPVLRTLTPTRTTSVPAWCPLTSSHSYSTSRQYSLRGWGLELPHPLPSPVQNPCQPCPAWSRSLWSTLWSGLSPSSSPTAASTSISFSSATSSTASTWSGSCVRPGGASEPRPGPVHTPTPGEAAVEAVCIIPGRSTQSYRKKLVFQQSLLPSFLSFFLPSFLSSFLPPCRHTPAFALLQRMLNFVQSLQYYMTMEVLEPNWCIFEKKLLSVATIDDVLRAHTDFLDTSLRDCLLSDRNILKTVSRLMELCLHFSQHMQEQVRLLYMPTPSHISFNNRASHCTM